MQMSMKKGKKSHENDALNSTITKKEGQMEEEQRNSTGRVDG